MNIIRDMDILERKRKTFHQLVFDEGMAVLCNSDWKKVKKQDVRCACGFSVVYIVHIHVYMFNSFSLLLLLYT